MKRIWVLHPLPLALMPILDLYLGNSADCPLSDIVRSVGLALIAAVALWCLHATVLHSISKGALLTSAALMFLAYSGNLWATVLRISPLSLPYTVLVILVGSFGAYLAMAFFLMRTQRDLTKINSLLNWAAAGIFVVQLGSLGRLAYQQSTQSTRMPEEFVSSACGEPIQSCVVNSTKPLPDIYYLILDGYGRKDMLHEFYEFDNSNFIKDLHDLGFFVADESRPNYC